MLSAMISYQRHSVFRLCIWALRECVIAYWKSVSMLCYKPNLQQTCRFGQRKLVTFWGQKVKGQRSRSQWEQMQFSGRGVPIDSLLSTRSGAGYKTADLLTYHLV